MKFNKLLQQKQFRNIVSSSAGALTLGDEPTFYKPYPRKLEILFICGFKGSTFSSVVLGNLDVGRTIKDLKLSHHALTQKEHF